LAVIIGITYRLEARNISTKAHIFRRTARKCSSYPFINTKLNHAEHSEILRTLWA